MVNGPNDLHANISNKLILYGDERTALLKANAEEELGVNTCEALIKLETWFAISGLKLNSNKT